MSTPRVSVIIPVHCRTDEHWQYLREALESVAAQTYRDFEIIIVDDTSPRDILPLVDAIDGLPSPRVLRNLTNMGHADSRNAGIRAADGEFVAFLDHDDLWEPDKLARQVETLDANPDAAMTFCDLVLFGPNAHRLRMDQSIIPPAPDFYWFVRHGNFTISATAVMVRRQAMIDIDLFDSRYTTCDDIDAWLKLLMAASCAHIPEKLARYRLHNVNANYSGDRFNDSTLMLRLIWRYWRIAPIRDKIKLLPRLARKHVGRVYFALYRYKRWRD